MSESNSTIDFGGALLLMRAGVGVKRLAWDKKRPIDRKYKIQIAPDGRGFKTWFLNYVSDTAIITAADLLAKDWIEVEP